MRGLRELALAFGRMRGWKGDRDDRTARFCGEMSGEGIVGGNSGEEAVEFVVSESKCVIELVEIEGYIKGHGVIGYGVTVFVNLVVYMRRLYELVISELYSFILATTLYRYFSIGTHNLLIPLHESFGKVVPWPIRN